jgi:hypothetical protein
MTRWKRQLKVTWADARYPTKFGNYDDERAVLPTIVYVSNYSPNRRYATGMIHILAFGWWAWAVQFTLISRR